MTTLAARPQSFAARIARMMNTRSYRNFTALHRAYNGRYSTDEVALPTFINRMKAAGYTTRVVPSTTR